MITSYYYKLLTSHSGTTVECRNSAPSISLVFYQYTIIQQIEQCLWKLKILESAYDYGGYNSHGLVIVRDRILDWFLSN